MEARLVIIDENRNQILNVNAHPIAQNFAGAVGPEHGGGYGQFPRRGFHSGGRAHAHWRQRGPVSQCGLLRPSSYRQA